MAGSGFIDSTAIFSGDVANITLTNVSCDASVYVKAAVIMDATGKAFNGLADDISTSNIIGFCIAKPTSTTCSIRVLGVTGFIFAALDPTVEYYLSDTVAGEISTTAPTASGHIVLKLGQPFSATEFLILKGSRVIRI